MNLLIKLCVFTLFSTVSSGVVQLVQNNPFLFYTQPATPIITPVQYQSFVPVPVGVRLIQPQATVLRNVQNIPRSNNILAATRVISNPINPRGLSFVNLRSQNTISRPVSTAVFRGEADDAVVIEGLGSGSNNNIQENIPFPVQQNPSPTYGVPNRNQPQQVIRTAYGAPIPTRSGYVTRQQPQNTQYEIQPARFVGELRSVSQGPIFPVTVVARNVVQRNRNNGHQLSRNTGREPGRSASHQQLRSQGGYGVSPIPVRNAVNGINRVQYYAVRYN